MVKNPRAAARPAGLLPLNLPQPEAVDADSSGVPVAVLVHGSLRPVVAVHDAWRIDDEWWRAGISRQYFAVEMEGGKRLTIFQDMATRAWYRQHYTPPVRIQAG